jgi:hypothetical protein
MYVQVSDAVFEKAETLECGGNDECFWGAVPRGPMQPLDGDPPPPISRLYRLAGTMIMKQLVG